MYPLLIYVHGFKSSSQSQKAEEIRCYLSNNHLQIEFLAPTFSSYPAESYNQLKQTIIEHKFNSNYHRKIALIGSSLGGFMATSASQEMNLKAVLINPVVNPDKLMTQYLGENVNPYTDEIFTLSEKHIDELCCIKPATLKFPEQLYVMLQTGDEILDYQLAKEYYCNSLCLIEEGGDHRFQHFDHHLPKLLEFLDLVD